MNHDIFNGDADGLCALHQLRLSEPREARLVTGVKRDIRLLDRVEAGAGDRLTVLDISLTENRSALDRLLAAGAQVSYFDHHHAGDLPQHPGFDGHIDTAPEVCTSLLVDAALAGARRAWAVVGAFGDNLDASARAAAAPLNLAAGRLDALRQLGIWLNYNAYGETLADLHFDPAALYAALRPYADPFAFLADEPACARLRAGYAADMAHVAALAPHVSTPATALYLLPDAAWSRRVSGVFANQLANAAPDRAHAVLVGKSDGGYAVSVRAPKTRPHGADALCRQFATGGGRAGAAGINRLEEADVERFAAALRAAYAD